MTLPEPQILATYPPTESNRYHHLKQFHRKMSAVRAASADASAVYETIAHKVKNLYSATVFGVFIGIIAGVPLTVLGELFLQKLRRRSFLKHVYADLSNAQRHFQHVFIETDQMASEEVWLKESRLKWMTFSSRGFLSHTASDYYLLSSDELERLTTFFVYMDNFDRLCDVLADHLQRDLPLSNESIADIKNRSGVIRDDAETLAVAIKPRIQIWSRQHSAMPILSPPVD